MVVVGAVAMMAATASGAPRVMPGWPVAAPAGAVHHGPGGGVVVTGSDIADGSLSGTDIAFGAAAYRLNGTRRWINLKTANCGNCDEGPQVAQRHPDGTYGPIGVEGDDYWAIDQAGIRVPGCAGVVLADATCIATRFVGSGAQFGLVAVRDGVVQWTHVEPDVSPVFANDVPIPVFADRSGTVYVTAPGRNTAAGTAPTRTMAVDAATGVLRWRRLDGTALAGLDHGVIMGDGQNLIAYAADGHELWRARGITGRVVVTSGTGRIYVGTSRSPPFGDGRRVIALDVATGVRLWATPSAETSTLMSIDSRGRALVAVRRDRLFSVRALGATGRPVWRLNTATEVVGARELAGGTVAVSVTGLHFAGGGLLLNIDARRSAPAVGAARMALSRTTVYPECVNATCDLPGRSTTLRIALPEAARVTIELVEPSGRPTPHIAVQRVVVRAPAGTSFVRLLAGRPFPLDGRHVVRVTWRDRGGLHMRLLNMRTR